MKSCKPHEKNKTKTSKCYPYWWKTENQESDVLCSIFFHVICKISNFTMWTAKHLVQASCAELTLQEKNGNGKLKKVNKQWLYYYYLCIWDSKSFWGQMMMLSNYYRPCEFCTFEHCHLWLRSISCGLESNQLKRFQV